MIKTKIIHIVVCDRCGAEVGLLDIRDEAWTSGYYDATDPVWARLSEATATERDICDCCMWKSPGYIATHGQVWCRKCNPVV